MLKIGYQALQESEITRKETYLQGSIRGGTGRVGARPATGSRSRQWQQGGTRLGRAGQPHEGRLWGTTGLLVRRRAMTS